MRSAFVSGAATGIGAGLVDKLLREGWRVFAGYRRSAPEDAPWFGHPRVVSLRCDVTDVREVEDAARQVGEQTVEKLDLLVNNAGYFTSGGVVEAADMEQYRRAFEVNLFGALHVLSAFMPMVRNGQCVAGRKGRVINVASSSTYMTFPLASAYTVSKQALKTATMHLRLELQPFGIDVCTLDPGAIETAMSEQADVNAAQQWSAIPGRLRAQYARHFIDAKGLTQQSHAAWRPDQFADEVYRRIITGKRVKPVYVLGPGVAAMPWMHRLLPQQGLEAVWARLFRTKASAQR